jgi:hypothetical protein
MATSAWPETLVQDLRFAVRFALGAFDLATFASAATLLLAVAVLASFVPARAGVTARSHARPAVRVGFTSPNPEACP